MSSLSPDVIDEVRDALDRSEGVDARQIDVAAAGDAVVLRGAVANPEQVETAVLIAEARADTVVNELRVDPVLREEAIEPAAGEPAEPAEDEVLVGETDMLAGPGSALTSDLDLALEENEPWDPPDEPTLPGAG